MSFYVFHDNHVWLVSTIVGEGLTKVKFDERQPQQEQPQSIEPTGEVAHG
jgi:hypothetical protein